MKNISICNPEDELIQNYSSVKMLWKLKKGRSQLWKAFL